MRQVAASCHPSLTLFMTRPSSAPSLCSGAPSPRARGEGEQVTHLRSVPPRPAERGEGDTKRSGVRVRGVSFAASSAHGAVPSLGVTYGLPLFPKLELMQASRIAIEVRN